MRLTVGGKTLEQPLTVRMDPRVTTPEGVLRDQYLLSVECWLVERRIRITEEQIQSTREQIADRRENADERLSRELRLFDMSLAEIVGTRGGGRRGQPRAAESSLSRVAADFATLMAELQAADVKPTDAVAEAIPVARKSVEEFFRRLEIRRMNELPPLNDKLRRAGLAEVKLDRAVAP